MSDKKINNKEIQDSWNSWSDEYYKKEYGNSYTLEIIKNTPSKAFPLKVWENIKFYFPDLHGIKVCVPSSGDNIAVFAFHLLGADVTSCDISSEQIKNAHCIAESQGWNINFHVCDSMVMDGINKSYYDLVYTSNGVHTWISDLQIMHSNFCSILKNNGKYIFFETHPFIRPFNDKTNELKIRKLYGDTSDNDWRIQDFVNSLIESGFSITRMDELYAEKSIVGASWWELSEWDEKSNWNRNPYAALPQWVSFCVRK